jgi:hypothetical protein
MKELRALHTNRALRGIELDEKKRRRNAGMTDIKD